MAKPKKGRTKKGAKKGARKPRRSSGARKRARARVRSVTVRRGKRKVSVTLRYNNPKGGAKKGGAKKGGSSSSLRKQVSGIAKRVSGLAKKVAKHDQQINALRTHGLVSVRRGGSRKLTAVRKVTPRVGKRAHSAAAVSAPTVRMLPSGMGASGFRFAPAGSGGSVMARFNNPRSYSYGYRRGR